MRTLTDRKITMSVVLSGEQITRLQEQARETGKSVSQIAREAVNKFFHEEQ